MYPHLFPLRAPYLLQTTRQISQVRADGLHRAAARGDAEVGHGAASPAFLQKIMV